MFAIERQQAILNIIDEKGNVTISELGSLFRVSTETIRKDLLILEKNGMLVRTHGGAVSNSRNKAFLPLSERLKEHVPEKAELCGYAVQFIQNGDIIAIDAGSTAIELSKLIAGMFTRLTVVTYSLDVFKILSPVSGIDVLLCGGIFNARENFFKGDLTLNMINQIHTMKLFLFPSAVSLKFGISDYTNDSLPLQQALMHNTDKVFVLADSEKLEKNAFIKLGDIPDEYTIITDSGVSDEIFDLYIKNNINIVKGTLK